MTGGGIANADPIALEERFARYADTRDPELRDELVRAHLKLAEYLAKRFLHRGVPADDLFQVASLALVKAVDRFDPERGTTFSTFATPTIIGELKRYFRDRGWALRVPRRLQELHMELTTTVGPLTQELGRSPTVAEIAAKSGMTEDEVIEATDVAYAYRAGSLDLPPNDDSETSNASWAVLGEIDSNLERVEHRMDIDHLLRALPPREQAIVHMRFFEGRTQSEIATRLGISQMQVSRLLARSISEVRRAVMSPSAEKASPPAEPDTNPPISEANRERDLR